MLSRAKVVPLYDAEQLLGMRQSNGRDRPVEKTCQPGAKVCNVTSQKGALKCGRCWHAKDVCCV